MTFTDKNLVPVYNSLIESLSLNSKIELAESLSKSIDKHKKQLDSKFEKAYGSFISDKTAEEIVKDLRKSRKFRKREINL